MASKEECKALILCAGLGSRMRPLTDTIPKPLISYKGMRMLDRLILQLRTAGINEIAINTHHLADVMREYVKQHHPTLQIMHEPELLLTGGSVKRALDEMHLDKILVVNCDAYFEGEDPFSAFLREWDNAFDMMLMCTAKSKDKKGDFCIKGNSPYLDSSMERTHIWTSPYIIKRTLLDGSKDVFPLQDLILPLLYGHHNIRIYEATNAWEDVGTYSSLSHKDINESKLCN